MSEADSLAPALLDHLTTLPFVSSAIPAVSGRLKQSPEDFVVEELPAYLPIGEGEHLYLWIEKRGVNTADAARMLAQSVGARVENAGWAGLKDKQAVTRQWVSLHHAATPRPEDFAIEGVQVLEVSRHVNKLRTGHLRGNRFVLRLCDVPEEHDVHVAAALQVLGERGLPNYYGAQRFGHGGRNLISAYGCVVLGERPPQKPFLRKLFMSALQGALFNAWLGLRLERQLYDRVLTGDVLRKEDTGGLFVCSDAESDAERANQWEISPTGPMFGARMKAPAAEALALENEVLARWGVDQACLARAERFGEGTRRVARVRPSEVQWRRDGADLQLEFGLPKGSYATVLVEELTKTRGLSLNEDP